jgi:hypothetical protein
MGPKNKTQRAAVIPPAFWTESIEICRNQPKTSLFSDKTLSRRQEQETGDLKKFHLVFPGKARYYIINLATGQAIE